VYPLALVPHDLPSQTVERGLRDTFRTSHGRIASISTVTGLVEDFLGVQIVDMDNRVRYYPASPYGAVQTSGQPSYAPFLPGSGQSDGKSRTEREKQIDDMSDRIPDCIPTNQQRCATPACQVRQVESDCANFEELRCHIERPSDLPNARSCAR
jgi:hypothetical protein